jgi:hypothetical protein
MMAPCTALLGAVVACMALIPGPAAAMPQASPSAVQARRVLQLDNSWADLGADGEDGSTRGVHPADAAVAAALANATDAAPASAPGSEGIMAKVKTQAKKAVIYAEVRDSD